MLFHNTAESGSLPPWGTTQMLPDSDPLLLGWASTEASPNDAILAPQRQQNIVFARITLNRILNLYKYSIYIYIHSIYVYSMSDCIILNSFHTTSFHDYRALYHSLPSQNLCNRPHLDSKNLEPSWKVQPSAEMHQYQASLAIPTSGPEDRQPTASCDLRFQESIFWRHFCNTKVARWERKSILGIKFTFCYKNMTGVKGSDNSVSWQDTEMKRQILGKLLDMILDFLSRSATPLLIFDSWIAWGCFQNSLRVNLYSHLVMWCSFAEMDEMGTGINIAAKEILAFTRLRRSALPKISTMKDALPWPESCAPVPMVAEVWVGTQLNGGSIRWIASDKALRIRNSLWCSCRKAAQLCSAASSVKEHAIGPWYLGFTWIHAMANTLPMSYNTVSTYVQKYQGRWDGYIISYYHIILLLLYA